MKERERRNKRWNKKGSMRESEERGGSKEKVEIRMGERGRGRREVELEKEGKGEGEVKGVHVGGVFATRQLRHRYSCTTQHRGLPVLLTVSANRGVVL